MHEPASELQPPPPLAFRLALLVVVAVIALLGVGLFLRIGAAMQEQAALEAEREATAAAAGAAAEVLVTRPEPSTSAPAVVLTGTLEPAQAADLAFEVPGRVARVEVRLGQTVTAGQVLVTLDRSSVGAQSAQTTAAIGVAEASAEMARDRVRLLEPLVARGTMAERELTTARQQLAIAEAQLQQARASQRQVAASSADHTLRAPFAGVITLVPNGVGVVANPGTPLVRVEDLSSLRLRTTVNRAELERIRVGMSVALDGPVAAAGTLEAVVRSLDQNTRRAPVEVRVPNPDGQLVANAFVRARIEVGDAQDVLRIPATARRPDGSVFVVGADGVVAAREVEAEVDRDGSWLVTDGLSPEDRVVVRPAALRVGVVVSPQLRSREGEARTAAVAP